MIIATIFFLVLTLALFADRLGWLTGKPVIEAQYFGLITAAVLVMLIFCAALTWKIACPGTDKWMTLECFKAASFSWRHF